MAVACGGRSTTPLQASAVVAVCLGRSCRLCCNCLQVATSKIDEYARGMISGSGSTLFEELGLYYIGPVDGHNVDDLVAVLNDVKSADTVGPVLIHVITEKGRGYLPAETAQDKMHGVVKFDPRTGKTTAMSLAASADCRRCLKCALCSEHLRKV